MAILHKQVEIGEGADVAAFRNVKPVGVGGSGYDSMASETCRIPGPVLVIPMRERHEDSGAPPEVATFQRPGKYRPRLLSIPWPKKLHSVLRAIWPELTG